MPKVLFICGSENQTSMMTRISGHLQDCDCYFTPYYGDGLVDRFASFGLLDSTILGRPVREQTRMHLEKNGYLLDPFGRSGAFDLVVTCSDLIIPKNLTGLPFVLVQEGMTDPENYRYRIVRALGLPRYLANTSMTGLSGKFRLFCVASEGFKKLFVRKGVPEDKIAVTGIPNFDDASSWICNDFPHRGYVLAATSHLRETFKYENRKQFIRKALSIADGRPVFFKLHPRERRDRAIREIRRHAPGQTVFDGGDILPMLANCDALVTRYSSVILAALALEKPVYSDYDVSDLMLLKPVQNEGRSAALIAERCRELLG